MQSDGVHYKEMAQKLRELARDLHFPGTRTELLELALRYDQKADDLDARTAIRSDQDQP